jgi:hypothetical protein
MKRIYLLFIPLLATIIFSCEESSKQVDPLFYQISVADSARCMNEILDGIRFEGKENQRFIDDLFIPGIPYCGTLDKFYIGINSSGRLMINMQLDSDDVIGKVFEYFIFNRNLTAKEVYKASVDQNHPGFNFPFYNKFNLKDIQRNKDSYQRDVEDLDKTDSDYLELLRRKELKVIDCNEMIRALELIDEKFFPQLGTAHVVFDYPRQSEKSEEILNDVALAFYHLRNFECIRYFNETYLSLFDRAQRLNRKIDLEKLTVLEIIQRPIIFHRPWKKNQ